MYAADPTWSMQGEAADSDPSKSAAVAREEEIDAEAIEKSIYDEWDDDFITI